MLKVKIINIIKKEQVQVRRRVLYFAVSFETRSPFTPAVEMREYLSQEIAFFLGGGGGGGGRGGGGGTRRREGVGAGGEDERKGLGGTGGLGGRREKGGDDCLFGRGFSEAAEGCGRTLGFGGGAGFGRSLGVSETPCWRSLQNANGSRCSDISTAFTCGAAHREYSTSIISGLLKL